MENIQAILFDKDGTLVAFSDIWVLATQDLIGHLASSKEAQGDLAKKVGILGDGSVEKNSPLGSGTNRDIAQALGIREKDLNEKFSSYLAQNTEKIKATTDLSKVLPIIKDRGIKIGLATSDAYDLTLKQLEALGARDYFDFIYASDTFAPKPSPLIFKDIEESYEIDKNNIIYVGDTQTDIDFGRHAGKFFGIRSEVSPEDIGDQADLMLEDLIDILNYI